MATFIVTSAGDVTASDGVLTLREAVDLANANPGADLIEFSVTGVIRLTQGQVDISEAVTIDGAGAGITITGDANGDDTLVAGTNLTDFAASAGYRSDNSRIFATSYGSGNLAIAGLTLTGGYTNVAGTGDGGAIQSLDTLTITDSVLSGNGTNANFAAGGAAYARNAVTITGSTVSDNVTLDSNSRGGGVYSRGTTTITDSVIRDNATETGSRGGGIYSLGNLTLSNSTVTGNTTQGTFGEGGGMFAGGYATVTDSTVSGNMTGGPLSDGGGIWALHLDLVNSTLSGNTVSGDYADGGGIWVDRTIEVTNSTISGNAALGSGADGGGIYVRGSGGLYGLTLTNSIVTGNVATVGPDDIGRYSFALPTVYAGGNIVGADVMQGAAVVGATTAADIFAATVNANGVDAGVLADNGGAVETIALKRDVANPALDAGDDGTAPPADARGEARYNAAGVANYGPNISDLGSFELQSETPSLVVTTAMDVVSSFDGLTSLREAVAFANSQTGADTVSFDGSVFTGGAANLIRLTQGQINIFEAVTIDGAGAGITITGDANGDDTLVAGTYLTDFAASAGYHSDNSRIFATSNSSGNVTIAGLTLTGGYTNTAGLGKGGAIQSFDSLTITDSVLSGNGTNANNADGGAVYSRDTLTITGSTLSDNVTLDINSSGGALYGDSTTTITDSVISDNTTQTGSRGGGIYSRGDLTLTNSTVSGNAALGTFSAPGGGIFAAMSATVTGSTVSGNSTSGQSSDGGGIWAIHLDFVNSTLSGNTTSGNHADGGGMRVDRTIEVTNSTISGNAATGGSAEGGGIFVRGFGGAYGLTLTNSIVTGNVATVGPDDIGAHPTA